MTFTYEREARRSQVWLRAFFMGPTGSGKSKGALELATRLFGGELPITLINTERGRGQLYADRYKFALIDMSEGGDFAPTEFAKAIDLAEREQPGGIIVLDSASHEWMGKGGVLQLADRFGDWKKIRPLHNDFVDRLLAVNGHVIVTCRAKMKYDVSEKEVPGRTKPLQIVTMLGVGPIQDDGLQYEFNLVGRFDVDTKDVTFSGHVDPLVDTVANFGDVEQAVQVAEKLGKWLHDGDPPKPPETATAEAVAELVASLVQEGITEDEIETKFATARTTNRGELHPDYVATNLAKSKERLAKKQAAGNGAHDAAQQRQEALA